MRHIVASIIAVNAMTSWWEEFGLEFESQTTKRTDTSLQLQFENSWWITLIHILTQQVIDMFESNLLIYTLGTIVVVLATILGTKAVRRRKNKPVNIWEGYANSPVAPQTFRAPSRPIVPPPPQAFNRRWKLIACSVNDEFPPASTINKFRN